MIKILVIINILVLRFYRYIGNILTNYENIKKNSKKVYIYIYIYIIIIIISSTSIKKYKVYKCIFIIKLHYRLF